MRSLRFWFRESSLSQEVLHLFLSLVLIGVTTALFFPLREVLGTAIIALLYLVPIGFNGALWGLGAGVVSAILAFLTLNYYFIPPYNTLFVHRSQDLVILIVFLGVTIVISQLVGRMRISLQAATAREREAVRLYDLMVELAGLQDEQAILDVLARQTRLAIEASYTVALVTLADEEKKTVRQFKAVSPKGELNAVEGFRYATTNVATQPANSEGLRSTTTNETIQPAYSELGRADLVAPIQMGGQFIGELRIWRRMRNFTTADLRLIRIFINQAVLTLERARLSRATTYARILEESNRLKSSLLSSVSHELRTPLATIKAAISSLRSNAVEWDSEARSDLLALVEEETDHLNLLVGNLLNMSRLESGALILERSWNALSDIIQSAVNRSAIYASQHQIIPKIAANLPFVYVDYILIEQVLLNLINNSLKFAPKGSTIQIIADQTDEQTILVQVTNEGPQIAEEYLDRIFDKFFQLEKPPATAGQNSRLPQGGTGLGLSICKGIIEAHGGRIWAKNRSNGIAFLFTIPIQSSQMSTQAVILKEMEK